MRTTDERPSSRNATAARVAPPAPGMAEHGPVTVRPRPGMPAPEVARLGTWAGNRAVSQLLAGRPGRAPGGSSGIVVQRYLGTDGAAAVADQLNEAMSGLGTDEEAIYGALAGRRGEDIAMIRDAYRRYGDLVTDLRDELTDEEYERVRPALEAEAEYPMTRAVRETEAVFRAADVAAQLHDAMAGMGTEEDQIFNALTGRTPTEIGQVVDEYRVDYGTDLEEDLRDELSGGDLERALQLIGRTDEGRVESREREVLVEGIDATVQGDFRYRLTDTRLEVTVPVRFSPHAGCTVQLSDWNAGIAAVWNQFHIAEPGGRRLELHMALADDSSAARVVEVIPNARSGEYANPDRADAGHFYQVMPSAVAAHEFGHLIGLADEYQRTARDIEVVTGERARTGMAASPTSLSARQVADQINGAITGGATPELRSSGIDGVLVATGLLVGNVPQQGAFAQEVRREYDTAYGAAAGGTDLMATLSALPNHWWSTSVFSYASGTVMGVQGAYGMAPHEHPVEPRHLREFLAIARNRWPDADWAIE